MTAALAAVGACSPDVDQSVPESAQSSRAASTDTRDTVLLTATDASGRAMSGDQIRATLLGGEKAAKEADAEAQSGASRSGGAQSGTSSATTPRGLAVVDPKTWEVEGTTDSVVGVEATGIRVRIPSGGAALAFVWPLSTTSGYSQVVIGDNGSPIRPGGTLDLTLRTFEELTTDLSTSVTDALADTSGGSPVPSLEVSEGLAQARRTLAAADPSPTPSASSGESGESAGLAPQSPTPSASASTTPIAGSLSRLDATWRTWLTELGRAHAGTATGTVDASPSAGTVPTPSASPSASPSATATDPLDGIWRAVTLDDASTSSVITALDEAKRAAGDGQGWVRIVADPDKVPSDYDLAVIAAHDRGLKVMLTPTDSSAAAACVPAGTPTTCSTDDYLARLTTYLDHFTGSGVPDVDAWEVGNEANGDWIDTTKGVYASGSGTMSVKVTTATTLVRSRTSAPVVLTLDWQLATSVHPESSTFSWAHSQASLSGAEAPDVVLLSAWVDTSPLGIGLLPALQHLATLFPDSKVGIGELGLHTGSDAGHYDEFGVAASRGTARDEARASLAGWYTQASTCVPDSIGGVFWWSFQEDLTGSGGQRLVAALAAGSSGS